MYRIYILHSSPIDVSDTEKEIFSRIDGECEPLACKTEDDIISNASDADAVLVHGAEITRNVLINLKRLKVVVRCGVGYDNIDIEAAKNLGIPVCNVPDYGTREVASHALALILCCLRKLTLLNDSVKAGKWDYSVSVPIRRMSEQTLGFAAFGRIAKCAASMAKPFGFRLLGYDRDEPEGVFKEYRTEKVAFERLLTESDVISCHVPLNEESRHMFNESAFLKMKKGSVFVNTSRGGVADEKALISALENGILSFAALDVFETEPLPVGSPLLRLPNVILTPHSAWYSEEAAKDLKIMAAEEAARVLSGKKPRNVVT